MKRVRTLLLIVLIASLAVVWAEAQALGSVEVSGRVKIEGKQEKLSRKRFYLLKGGLKDNQDLITRLKAAQIRSRDCYYSQMKASPEFICWLQAENCESPFCRAASDADIQQVPEFQTAYKKGLTQFKGLAGIARDWITTNLPPIFTSGYYQERKTLTSGLLGGLRPLQSAMTDSVTVRAIFIDIPVDPPTGKKTGTFLISNILPIEFGTKSYLWACEVEIGTDKPAALRLLLPENNKPVKNCEVMVRDLEVCKTAACKTT
jgi:hypothetical protein